MNHQHLERVTDRIAEHVLAFCRTRIQRYWMFTMDELQRYVSEHVRVAPDSPSRILRQLRLSGALDYVVVDRSKSLYRVTAVRRAA